MFITNPETFAEWFKERCPGAYRQVTSQDIRDLTACGLIHRYGHYSREEDGKTILAIMQYEQMRDNRPKEQTELKGPPICKMCGKPLTPNSDVKPGRHKEYCPDCDRKRNSDRQNRVRRRRRQLITVSNSTSY